MLLREHFEHAGGSLFRWRSYLPLTLVGLLIVGLRNLAYPFHTHNVQAGHVHWLEQLWELLCLAATFSGLAIRVYTVGHAPRGTSGRNTLSQRADVLNTTGVYSLVRHPLYLGNYLCGLGFAMFCRSGWIVVVYSLLFWLYYERIIFVEEEFLRRKFGRRYLEWAARTAAFVPCFSAWEQNCTTFSIRTVLKREYSGFLLVVATFALLELSENYLAESALRMDPLWIVLLLIAVLTYATLRTLKKAGVLDCEKKKARHRAIRAQHAPRAEQPRCVAGTSPLTQKKVTGLMPPARAVKHEE